MLALPALLAVPTSADEAAPGASLAVVIVVGLATVVLLSIALDLRRLRRAARLRVVHGVMGAAFTAIVVGGTLAVTLAIGSAPPATADQPLSPAAGETAPAPQSIDTGDITDQTTDIQLPTLALD